MATAQQVKGLIRCHFEGEPERFATIALQIAAHEARAGHATLAHEIRQYIDRARRRHGVMPGVTLSRDLSDLLLQSNPRCRLAELIAPADLRQRLERILDEYRHRKKLKQHGLAPRRKILLAGPPGTGKTMTASVLSAELRLALHTILMHKLVTKFMGETSAKLRQIFDIIQEEPGVYLFDEFDAIGTQRGRENEVGEMRRVLNSFLQFIEQDTSDSMIIAATNTFDVLDTALFRRFDDVVYYDLPTQPEREELIELRLRGFMSASFGLARVAQGAEGLSHAEITRACDDAIKHVVLSRKKKVSGRLLSRMLAYRRSVYEKRGLGRNGTG
jgi:SpoVK/Ycf46/Vps4 family AAA+-type ATPase